MLMLTQVQPNLSPSERVYPTWQSCAPSGGLRNNRKPVQAPPDPLWETEYNFREKAHKHNRISGVIMQFFTMWHLFSYLSLAGCPSCLKDLSFLIYLSSGGAEGA